MFKQMETVDEHNRLYEEHKADVHIEHVLNVENGCTCSYPVATMTNAGQAGKVSFSIEQETDPYCPLHGYETE